MLIKSTEPHAGANIRNSVQHRINTYLVLQSYQTDPVKWCDSAEWTKMSRWVNAYLFAPSSSFKKAPCNQQSQATLHAETPLCSHFGGVVHSWPHVGRKQETVDNCQESAAAGGRDLQWLQNRRQKEKEEPWATLTVHVQPPWHTHHRVLQFESSKRLRWWTSTSGLFVGWIHILEQWEIIVISWLEWWKFCRVIWDPWTERCDD